jgi:serine/threonine protein kinase
LSVEDKLYLAIIAVLGPIPPDFIKAWESSDHFVDANGVFLPSFLSQQTYVSPPLEQELADVKFLEMDQDEQAVFTDFLRRMLVWEPEKRWSAQQLLKHDWFVKYGVSGAEFS